MNMINKQAAVKNHCIENLKNNVKNYPGYPTEKFVLSKDESETTVPAGNWDTSNSGMPSYEVSNRLRAQMCKMDENGRPLHPWYDELVHSIGVVAGRGKYWNWGPNYTVDPIVIADTETGPKLLLIKRLDSGKWALPGGFLDYISESTISASVRECGEETGVAINGKPEKTIYIGPVADERTTAHAWAYTNAKLWILDAIQPTTPQLDEVEDAQWHSISNLPKNLHGSHAKIIEFAFQEIE